MDNIQEFNFKFNNKNYTPFKQNKELYSVCQKDLNTFYENLFTSLKDNNFIPENVETGYIKLSKNNINQSIEHLKFLDKEVAKKQKLFIEANVSNIYQFMEKGYDLPFVIINIILDKNISEKYYEKINNLLTNCLTKYRSTGTFIFLSYNKENIKWLDKDLLKVCSLSI